MQTMIKHKPLNNAGSIEIEKMILSLYIKGAISKTQIKELAETLQLMAKELPDDKDLH